MNVMNRHPAVVARMASTLHIATGGRLVLGIGSAARRKSTLRMASISPRQPNAWHGSRRRSPSCGRCGRRSRDATVAVLPVGGCGRAAGARSATPDHRGRRDPTRRGPGGTDRRRLEHVRGQLRGEPAVYLEALESAGKRREDQTVIVGFQGEWLKDASSVIDSPWVTAPRETWERWRNAGADSAIVTARTTEDVDALVESTARW
jgi:hypothetical protein